jgi:hypothetical protein
MKDNHLTHMLFGGAGILALLLFEGVPLGTALTFAFVLACPLMMVAMMFMMNRGNDGHGGGGRGGYGHDHGPDDPTEARRPEPKTDRELKAIDAKWRR